MKKIGLLSDTHGFLDEKILDYFDDCDEVWHAGDIGNLEIAERLAHCNGKSLKAVYGNVDGSELRSRFPERLRWRCEGVEVLMTHIGGRPGKYAPGIREELSQKPAQLFICGHSHILKIMYDDKLKCLYMNPGAAGKQGWHKQRTILRFIIDGNKIRDCEVIELMPR